MARHLICGNVELMHAVKEFDPYKGVKLITYAVWWIRGYIQEYLMRQYSMVRIGTTQNQRTLFYKLQKQKQDLEQLGEENGIRQISGRLGIPEDEVAEMHKRLSGRDVSLSQPLGQGESSRLLDLQTGDQGTEMDDMIELKEHLGLLNNALAQLRPLLSEKETYILDQRLLSDSALTLQDIGSEWGVTREAVRQMEARLLAKIKDAILRGGLPPLSEPSTTS
jgi:RNA polymerase sigma-32 factor